MKDHFICTGTCKGISETPGTCQASSCEKYGKPLDACYCEDGKHFGRQDASSKDEDADKTH